MCADDDPDDRLLIEEALRHTRLSNELYFVEDGQELLEFLRHEGRYAQREEIARPGLILLDLNMPRVNGPEALTQIKRDPALRQIPVVVLTTSQAETDVARTYDLGANSYIVKPVTFESLVRILSDVGRYWFETVTLPS